MSKYIIDIPNGIEWGVVTCRTEDGFYTRDFDSLEELNSDYINEHYGELQDEAYKAGMNKAWGLAEDVIYNRGNVLDILHCATVGAAFDKYSAGQALDILRAYKKKQIEDDRIEVGDEVEDSDGDKTIVTNIHGNLFDGLCSDGSVMSDLFLDDNRKTGKHYDIASILEAMRE